MFLTLGRLRSNFRMLGPLGLILGPLGAVLGPSWALLGPSWGHLGVILGALVASLGPSWASLGPRNWRFRSGGAPKMVGTRCKNDVHMVAYSS